MALSNPCKMAISIQ